MDDSCQQMRLGWAQSPMAASAQGPWPSASVGSHGEAASMTAIRALFRYREDLAAAGDEAPPSARLFKSRLGACRCHPHQAQSSADGGWCARPGRTARPSRRRLLRRAAGWVRLSGLLVPSV